MPPPSPPKLSNAISILEARIKSLPGEAYKTVGGLSPYGMDVVIPEDLEINEAEMSVWIPFASGVRRDGVGDLLHVEGIDCDRHRKNSICLWDHGKQVSLPIGTARNPINGNYDVVIDPIKKLAKGCNHFYQGKGLKNVASHDDYKHAVFCEQIFDLYRQKICAAGSIGYSVKRASQLQPDYTGGVPGGLELISILMLEFSGTVIPASPDTVVKTYNLSPSRLDTYNCWEENVRRTLSLKQLCGKPLSPILVKSLSVAIPQQTKVVTGYEGQSKSIRRYELSELSNATENQLNEACRKASGSAINGVSCKITGEHAEFNGPSQLIDLAIKFLSSKKSYGNVERSIKSFQVGDRVRITAGEGKGGGGKVTNVSGGNATVQLDLGGSVDVPFSQLSYKSIQDMQTKGFGLLTTVLTGPYGVREIDGQWLILDTREQDVNPVLLHAVPDCYKVVQGGFRSRLEAQQAAEDKWGEESGRVSRDNLKKIKSLRKKYKNYTKGMSAMGEMSGGALISPAKQKTSQPSDNISPAKARQILKDGEVNGHSLTEKQRGMFGAAAGKKDGSAIAGGTGSPSDKIETQSPIIEAENQKPPKDRMVSGALGFAKRKSEDGFATWKLFVDGKEVDSYETKEEADKRAAEINEGYRSTGQSKRASVKQVKGSKSVDSAAKQRNTLNARGATDEMIAGGQANDRIKYGTEKAMGMSFSGTTLTLDHTEFCSVCNRVIQAGQPAVLASPRGGEVGRGPLMVAPFGDGEYIHANCIRAAKSIKHLRKKYGKGMGIGLFSNNSTALEQMRDQDQLKAMENPLSNQPKVDEAMEEKRRKEAAYTNSFKENVNAEVGSKSVGGEVSWMSRGRAVMGIVEDINKDSNRATVKVTSVEDMKRDGGMIGNKWSIPLENLQGNKAWTDEARRGSKSVFNISRQALSTVAQNALRNGPPAIQAAAEKVLDNVWFGQDAPSVQSTYPWKKVEEWHRSQANGKDKSMTRAQRIKSIRVRYKNKLQRGVAEVSLKFLTNGVDLEQQNKFAAEMKKLGFSSLQGVKDAEGNLTRPFIGGKATFVAHIEPTRSMEDAAVAIGKCAQMAKKYGIKFAGSSALTKNTQLGFEEEHEPGMDYMNSGENTLDRAGISKPTVRSNGVNTALGVGDEDVAYSVPTTVNNPIDLRKSCGGVDGHDGQVHSEDELTLSFEDRVGNAKKIVVRRPGGFKAARLDDYTVVGTQGINVGGWMQQNPGMKCVAATTADTLRKGMRTRTKATTPYNLERPVSREYQSDIDNHREVVDKQRRENQSAVRDSFEDWSYRDSNPRTKQINNARLDGMAPSMDKKTVIEDESLQETDGDVLENKSTRPRHTKQFTKSLEIEFADQSRKLKALTKVLQSLQNPFKN